ncbi:MAG: class I SAM-dependent methyltransferase [Acidobacteriia bacterium]|nr:class I SAM-dependent methyltransferase [Terriglobia bacterium]
MREEGVAKPQSLFQHGVDCKRMDAHTEKTAIWLNERYRAVDESGVYLAHQPIYGFRSGPTEEGILRRYVITYQIMRALAHLQMESLLDVGCSEGFKTHLAAEFFGIPMRGCDLSEEACRRAHEIFKVTADVVDIHEMPYADGEFDVLLCSETLEHATDFKKALSELMRVARRTVVISVPHEPEELVERNRAIDEPHAHFHSFDEHSFDFLREAGHQVFVQKILSPIVRIGSYLVDAHQIKSTSRRAGWMIALYNAIMPLLNLIFGERAATAVLHLDEYFSRHASSYEAIIVTVMKDGSVFRTIEKPHISAREILRSHVPLHYLKGQDKPR